MSEEITRILAKARFKPKSATKEEWESANPILLSGEPGVVVDGDETEKIKFGDGVKHWNELSWWKGPKGEQGIQGEKGEQGDKGDSGVYVGSGDMPEGYNVQINPDGKIFDSNRDFLFKKADIITNISAMAKNHNLTDSAEYPLESFKMVHYAGVRERNIIPVPFSFEATRDMNGVACYPTVNEEGEPCLTVGQITCTAKADGTLHLTGKTIEDNDYPTFTFATNVEVPAGTYTFSELSGGEYGQMLFRTTDSGTSISGYVTPSVEGSESYTFSTTTTRTIKIYFTTFNSYLGDGEIDITIKPQLELGTVATEYEPVSYVDLENPTITILKGEDDTEPQQVIIPYTFTNNDSLTLADGIVKTNIGGVETDITNTECGQELLALHTNYPNTIISCDAKCEVAYKADTKIYIDNKFANLQQAIISLGGNV